MSRSKIETLGRVVKSLAAQMRGFLKFIARRDRTNGISLSGVKFNVENRAPNRRFYKRRDVKLRADFNQTAHFARSDDRKGSARAFRARRGYRCRPYFKARI